MKKWLLFCLVICVLLSSACRASGGTTPVPATATVALSAPKVAATATTVPPTATSTRAPTAPPPTPTPIPPGVDGSDRQGAEAAFLWRVGSTSPELAELSFTTFGGMDATDTAVYIADAYNGVYIFDLEGNYQGQLAQGEIGYVADVKIGPDGDVYMVEIGFRQIVHFNADGDLLGAFGGYGTGDGEFSGDSPAALAVGLDGSVYALDIGDTGTRVQMFTAEGEFLRSFPIEAELSAKAMDVGPDGTLFLTGAGGYILELTPDDGRVIQRLGQESLEDAFPQMLSIDDTGNFYVVTWSPPGAVKLDAQGHVLETIGTEAVNDGVTGWPEGEFVFPVGIAVTGDGRYLFIGDSADEFAFLTAYRYP